MSSVLAIGKKAKKLWVDLHRDVFASARTSRWKSSSLSQTALTDKLEDSMSAAASISDRTNEFLQNQYGEHSTTVFRDLSLNFKKILEESPLDEQERFLNLLAISTTLNSQEMMEFAVTQLRSYDLPMEAIQEAKESAAIMGMLNTYYKFKGFLSTEVTPNYARTGLRMNSLSKPQNGKERFEQMAFSVSVVNGCPTCVSSHEKALTDLGMSADKIHDLARLASVCKGLVTLKKALS
jgi:lipoyl-dependent peroxiredoxin subunit D